MTGGSWALALHCPTSEQAREVLESPALKFNASKPPGLWDLGVALQKPGSLL